MEENVKETVVDTGSFAQNVETLLDDIAQYIMTMRPTDRMVIDCTEDGILLHVQPGLFRHEYKSTQDAILDELTKGWLDYFNGGGDNV
jgi:hypothetical protein